MKIIALVGSLIGLLFGSLVHASERVVVISDLNSEYGSKTYHPAVAKSIVQISKLQPDLVISTGDMVAGQKAGLDYKGMWSSFHNVITKPLTELNIPFAVTPGNHDGSGEAGFKTERKEFVSQWNQFIPKVKFVDQVNYPVYYAFAVKNVLFVSLDATISGKLSATQMAWLEGVLTKNSHYTKKVLFGHLPIFPVSQTRETQYLNDPALIKLMQDQHVDLYLSGHHHAYYPGVYEGIRQISQGCLGAGPRKMIGSTTTTSRAITVIDFEDDGNISVEALGGTNLDQLIERKTLPEKISTQGKQMWRDDLAE